MGFFDGDMTAKNYLANQNAVFYPAAAASGNNGSYTPPCVMVGGVQVYAYVRDGILVVSLHYDTADTSPDSPFALYGFDDCVPTVIKAGDREPVWEALPDQAVSEDDHRQLRKAGVDEPGDWVLPGWVHGE
jgi:hypothetical protein